jgi:hypothetical protein
VLSTGAVPMGVLEAKIDSWIAAHKKPQDLTFALRAR